MATDYPDDIDSLPRPTAATAMNASGFEGDVVIDNISDAIEAIETELGTNPSGAYATVAAAIAAAGGGGGVSVMDYGATGDGTTDDTSAINSCIAANGGRRIFFPAGTYMINAIATSSKGILLNQAGTSLILDQGATLKCITNSATTYAVIYVSAADCVVEGGRIEGDVGRHTGGTGEWGMGININAGADRFRAINVYATLCWGDGFYVAGGVEDVQIINCIADDNRRQGLSIVGGTRTQVLGGAYINTGATASTAPAAGIDVEPNPSSGIDCDDFLISGVTFYGNGLQGGLMLVAATGVTTSGLVANCMSTGNYIGVKCDGTAGTFKVTIEGMTVRANTLRGFWVGSGVCNPRFISCTADSNSDAGFYLSNECYLLNCEATNNGTYGVICAAGSTDTQIVGGHSIGNSTAVNNNYSNVYAAVAINVIGHATEAGSNANKPKYGFDMQSTTSNVAGCTSTGSFGTAATYGPSVTTTTVF